MRLAIVGGALGFVLVAVACGQTENMPGPGGGAGDGAGSAGTGAAPAGGTVGQSGGGHSGVKDSNGGGTAAAGRADNGGSDPTGGQSGASTGGTTAGGKSSGGASTGGASTGGRSGGGASTGGASTGGASTGGRSGGGASTGGASTGGTGGAPQFPGIVCSCSADKRCVKVTVTRTSDITREPWVVWPTLADGSGTLVVSAVSTAFTLQDRVRVPDTNFLAADSRYGVALCVPPGTSQVRAFLDHGNDENPGQVSSSDYLDSCPTGSAQCFRCFNVPVATDAVDLSIELNNSCD